MGFSAPDATPPFSRQCRDTIKTSHRNPNKIKRKVAGDVRKRKAIRAARVVDRRVRQRQATSAARGLDCPSPTGGRKILQKESSLQGAAHGRRRADIRSYAHA